MSNYAKSLDDADTRPVAVVGAGTLGRRIALMFSTRGGEVRIFDQAPTNVTRPLSTSMTPSTKH